MSPRSGDAGCPAFWLELRVRVSAVMKMSALANGVCLVGESIRTALELVGIRIYTLKERRLMLYSVGGDGGR